MQTRGAATQDQGRPCHRRRIRQTARGAEVSPTYSADPLGRLMNQLIHLHHRQCLMMIAGPLVPLGGGLDVSHRTSGTSTC